MRDPLLNSNVATYVVSHSTLIFFPFLGPMPIYLSEKTFFDLLKTDLTGPNNVTNAVM